MKNKNKPQRTQKKELKSLKVEEFNRRDAKDAEKNFLTTNNTNKNLNHRGHIEKDRDLR